MNGVRRATDMGQEKRLLEEQWERGWELVGDRFVCGACFDDAEIAAFIAENAEQPRCDYCKAAATEDQAIAAPVNSVFEFLADAIRYEWQDPSAEVPAEGGEYVFPPSSTDDLVWEIPIPIVTDALLEEFLDSFADLAWVPTHFFSLREDEALRSGWEDFVRHVTQRVRFFFADVPGSQYGDIPVNDVLSRIESVVKRVGLISEMPGGTDVYRVRVHGLSKSPTSASDLGPPPPPLAAQNRMSPAGISMFYGALDQATALEETPPSDWEPAATVGVFVTRQPLLLFDLGDIPPAPSYWDPNERPRRRAIAFLHKFADAISIPIERDGREHINYVPTQVLTEYFRHVFRVDGQSIAGIRYRSAKNGGGVCVVLFAGNEEYEAQWSEDKGRFGQWLELDPARTKRVR